MAREQSSSSSANIALVKMNSPPDLEAGRGSEDTDSLMCSACDPTSAVPHEMHVSRFRIANLCCAGEGMFTFSHTIVFVLSKSA